MKEDSKIKYKPIITEDGSTTYFSPLYNETCHSLSGAKNETELHYIKGCQVQEKAKINSPLNILEVGFGTGLGFLVTKEALKDNIFHFVSFEIDLELIKIFENQQNIQFTQSANLYHYKAKNYDLSILHGNGRNSVLELTNIIPDFKAHAIYQDAFSPKRNAILWTKEWFELLKKLADKDCIMSTYSSSSSIRKSMLQAGWSLYNGEQFGPKRSSTRACLNQTTSPEIIDKLNRSPVEAITDLNYLSYTLKEK